MLMDSLADVQTLSSVQGSSQMLPAGTSQIAGIWRNLLAGSSSRSLVGRRLGSESLRIPTRDGRSFLSPVKLRRSVLPGPTITELV